MKNILFSHSYFLRFDPKQWKTGQPYAPLGTLYAAALMRQQGYTVALFDIMFAHSPADALPAIEAHKPDFFVLYDDGFNYLTKMCLTNMRDAAFSMIKLAKQKGCTVIVSSSDATDHYAQYLAQGADYVLLGEAELTLLEVANAINSGSADFSAISGLAFIQNGSIVKTTKRAVIRQLDTLPLPAWDLVDFAPYKKMWMQSTGYFSINIGTTRGCPFKCNWCAKPIYGNRYNSRSPENVVQELKLLAPLTGFKHVWFCDDIFGLKPGWVQQFAHLVQQEKLQFAFKIQSRADLLVEENYITALTLAGCDEVWMGAESGSQKILDAMDKGTTTQQIATATKALKKHNIKPAFFIQFGYLGETKEDIAQTIHMINTLLPHNIGISVSYPLPGTVFYDKVKQDLKEKTNWTDSDEMQLMFHNTYQPAFYKQLYKYVHKTYRQHLGMQSIKTMLTHPAAITGQNLKKAAAFFYHAPATLLAKYKLNLLSKI